MSSGKYTYFIEQGTTSELFIKYKDQNGNPISLVDYSAQMQFRPNYADAHLNLGRLLYRSGKTGEAARSFKEVIRLAPDSDEAREAQSYLGRLR